MIDTGVIHLSRARELNDLNEIERPNVGMWDRVYIASFSYRKRESMAMWGLYCDPFADAVRLHFPLPALRSIVRNAGVNGVIPLMWDAKMEKWRKVEKLLQVKSARMTDVVYKTKNTSGSRCLMANCWMDLVFCVVLAILIRVSGRNLRMR